jgi:hypothetical protein
VIAIVEYREENVVAIRLDKEAQKRVEKLLTNSQCLGCEIVLEPEDNVRCGMCDTCYQAAIRAIEKKKTSRQKLIASGRMLPPARGGKKPSNKFTQELSEL